MTAVDVRTTGAGHAPAPGRRTEAAILAGLSPAEYRDRVLHNLTAPLTSPLWQALTSDRLIVRTRNVLAAAAERAQRQLDRWEAGDERREPGWTQRQAAFRSVLRRRQAELQQVRPAVRPTDADLVRRLTAAIATHRIAVQLAEVEPEPYDAALWAVLDRLEA